MYNFHSGQCPACHSALQIGRLTCPNCNAEYPISEPLSPYDGLTEKQATFLYTFLTCRGNQKLVGERLGLSHPTVSKSIDELLVALGYAEKPEKGRGELDMSKFTVIDHHSVQASEIVRKMLCENGGAVSIPLFSGEMCRVFVLNDGCSFTSDKLTSGYGNYIKYQYRVFDDIVELLLSSRDGRARKGNGHGKADKVGYGKCTEDTVVGAIALKYAKKNIGDSTYDPVFVLAAILDWAGIAHNRRGYMELTANYKKMREL